MDNKFVTSSEIASKFGVNDSTVRRWCRRGLFRGADLKFVPPFGSVWVVPTANLQYFKPPKNGRPKMTAAQIRQNLIVKLYKERFKCEPTADLLEKPSRERINTAIMGRYIA